MKQMGAGAAASALRPATSDAFRFALSEPRGQPNIIFVMSDTHRYNAMSFTSEFVDIRMPNMDRMKEEGVNFTNCFASYPLCSPFRAMMQTGKWPWETGHIDNHMDLQYRMDRTGDLPARQRHATLGHAFTQAGYRAVHVGKWHQGLDQNAQVAGYDLSYIWRGERHEELSNLRNGASRSCPPYEDMLADGSGVRYSGVPATGIRPDYPTHPYKIIGETDQALGVLQQHDFEKQPLFMVLALQDPHGPFTYQSDPLWPVEVWDEVNFAHTEHSAGWQPGRPNHPPHTLDQYDINAIQYYPYDEIREGHREMCWHYYASITAVDDQLGRVMRAVEAMPPDVRDNTLVIYTSDHGGMNGQYGERNGNKVYPNDASSHVPFLVWGPGLIRSPGRDCDALIGCIDLFPTLCGLGRVDTALQRARTPDAQECLAYLRRLDGIDHSRNIWDGRGPDPESLLLLNPSNCNGPARPAYRAVVTKDYLYAVQGHWRAGNVDRGFTDWNEHPGPWLLFDRHNDRYEQNNLIAEPAMEATRAQLRELLRQWLDQSEKPEWFDRFLQHSHYAPLWRDEMAERSEQLPFDLDALV